MNQTKDPFDALLVTDVNVLRKQAGDADAYGNRPATLAVIATVKARVSKPRLRPYERLAGTRFSGDRWVVYMRPFAGLTEHDFLQEASGGPLMNVMNVSDAAGAGHHLEVLCEVIKP